MASINSNDLYVSLMRNFADMEKTIADGRAQDIDLGFIEIFIQDIKELEGAGFDKSKIHALSERLSSAADRICEATSFLQSTVKADAVRPLVGKEQRMSDLAKAMSAGDTKRGLEALDEHYTLKRVAGDGHCLFRAIAAGTLDYLNALPPPEQERFMQRLQATVDGLKDEKLSGLFRAIQVVRGISKEESLNTKKTSELLVEFLRNLACAYNKNSSNEVLQGLISEKYLESMCDMAKKEHGGEPELIALRNTLGLDLRVVDAIAVGKGQVEAASYKENRQPHTVFLLYTPAHYDIAY